MNEMLKIHKYTQAMEKDWLNCYMFAYFHSQYYDEMIQIKPRYDNPSIELVAIQYDEILGFLDVEIEREEGQFCYNGIGKGGLISFVGVHPKSRRQGIATKLFEECIKIIKEDYALEKLEIWIKEDSVLSTFLNSLHFTKVKQYYQIYLTTDFFDKYVEDLPFGITPNLLIGNIEQEDLKELVLEHAPEQTYPFVIYEKRL
ncbi:MAG: N-acetyltransferase [Candidatus Heimdallarchaeota archaeon]|nr:N-acetyltransferase [Candidatus Heimdallarchaeota archaeon]